MASLFNTSPMLIFFFLFLISVVPSSIANKPDIQHKICSKTSNPQECLNLKHVKTSKTLEAITKASIVVALQQAKDIHTKINAVSKKEKDKFLNNLYWHCSKNYNDAIRDLTIAKRSFNSYQFDNIPIETVDAEQEVQACKTVFLAAKRDPANLKNGNEKFYLLAQIARQSSEELVKKISGL
ncbi:pectinesterase inhibitor [Coffea arabica]|uniref:Pectinesterase inhibitor n=1 Tax=Coffea arabica TaxID=13443 RepID=A0A6P6U7N6_COFAR|nr:uncharacterized protein LOC113708172 [Coffea arabica]